MSRKFWKKLVCISIAATMCIGAAPALASETTVAGTYEIMVEAFDWGPSVTKLIVNLDRELDAGSVSADTFKVTEHKQIMDFATMTVGEADYERQVLDVHLSDEDGAHVDGASSHICIEMYVGPNDGSPFFYDFLMTGQNKWADPYTNLIELNEGQTLKSGGVELPGLVIAEEPTWRNMPQADAFERVTGEFKAQGGIELQYAAYAPKTGSASYPLIIWLHGAGEGGVDPDIVLLGNKVTALVGEKIQGYFENGAYVLCPQSPTMWMDNGDKNPETGAPVYVNDQNNVSIYTAALMELIEGYVAEHKEIDRSRILIGGCSNGGFMTLNMLIHYPDYFRAAYPICEAYLDSWISDEDIAKIKDVPIWFTYADTDTVVDPALNAAPTAKRLEEAGAEVFVSRFDKVLDTSGEYKMPDGSPYEYMGHWSWLYAFNDECVVDGQSMWAWLASKK